VPENVLRALSDSWIFPMALKQNPLEILYDDADFVAVLKPAGLATIPGRAELDSVLERLGRELNLPSSGLVDPRLRVVHRLDKDTSGVLLFAKHVDAQRFVSEQFRTNTIQKEYLALVAGRPNGTEGVVDGPLAPHPTSRDRMCVTPHGRRAITEWKLEQSYRIAALLRVFPKTGRTHQIRVHLKSIGLPLLIDPLYHVREPGFDGVMLSTFKRDYRPSRGHEERPLISRLTLHAEKLVFLKPGGDTATIVAPAPRDFRATVNQLGRVAGR